MDNSDFEDHRVEHPAWLLGSADPNSTREASMSRNVYAHGVSTAVPQAYGSSDLDFRLSEQLAHVRPNHLATPGLPNMLPQKTTVVVSNGGVHNSVGLATELQTNSNEINPSIVLESIGFTAMDLPGTVPIPQGLRYISPSIPSQTKIVVKSSIPPIENTKYIQECEAAAVASRLPPNHMSPLETSLMREHISHLQISTYVITRNAILRLWIKNPMIWVTIEEAQGVAREERHFLLCRQIWEFLVRNGYINFGCLELPDGIATKKADRAEKQILVVGAGVAGLCTARQLQNLLHVFDDRLEYKYKVTVLEAKSRLGGRVYSHELASTTNSDGKPDLRGKVDLGAQIVTGFSGGNPLTVLLQRQLAIPYHTLVHAKNNKIHGTDGMPIDPSEDAKVEGLFNLLLEAAARFRFSGGSVNDVATVEGDTAERKFPIDLDSVSRSESNIPTKLTNPPEATVVAVADKILGVSKTNGVEAAKALDADPIAELKDLGFVLRAEATMPPLQKSASLGRSMTNVLDAYASIFEITETHRRILYWHWANMEYACGTNLDNLSLEHWDQDDGNEFKGNHSMIVGGYSQLVRGLALAPSKLDIRPNSPVSLIGEQGLVLTTGEPLKADKVVCAVSLGVLKANSIEFTPSLPEWKIQAIENLGFGLLNKVVLVFEEQFWDKDIDLLGTLPLETDAEDARFNDRGRFYMFWNCVAHSSGRNVLVALMAGDAALAAEACNPDSLVDEARAILQRIYKTKTIPQPIETIVTKWGKDPYALGSYSYIGPSGSGTDYEALARPVGQHWFFAGEATCRTHPSTVHGAYLSGLAAAKAVLESIIGEQVIPFDTPLVPVKPKPTAYSSARTDTKKRKFETSQEHSENMGNSQENARQLQKQRLAEENDTLAKLILERIGPRPEQPKRTNANPFLIFQKDQWNKCRDIADEAQRKKLNNPDARASKNQIRACLGQTWRDTSENDRKPWVDIVNARRDEYEALKSSWILKHSEWERECARITEEFKTKSESDPAGQEVQDLMLSMVQDQKSSAEAQRSAAEQVDKADSASDYSSIFNEG